jgi:hypothetical protein
MRKQYPLEGIASLLAEKGRMGDTMLVHMNPIEVEGLAALSPTGQLSTNPDTGQPEAFLPLLIPLAASMGGSALAGAAGAGLIGSAMAGGLASGVATGAITGDWERGLYSGIAGAGLGAAAGAAGAAAGDAAAAGTDVAATGVDAIADEALASTVLAETGDLAAAGADVSGGIASPITTPIAGSQPLPNVSNLPAVKPSAEAGYGSGFDMSKVSGESFGQALKQPWQAPEGEGMMTQIMKPRTMMPMALGLNQVAELEAQEGNERDSRNQEKEDAASRLASYNRLQNAYSAAQPGVATGYSPFRANMSSQIPGPWRPPGYALGGMTTMQGKRKGEPGYGQFGMKGANAYGGIDPVEIQARLRGVTSVSPPAGYRPGFDPEFDYFQNVEAGDTAAITTPPSTTEEQWRNMYPAFQRMDPLPEAPATPSILIPKNVEGGTAPGMAAGGEVMLNTPAGPVGVPAGGIADIPNQYNQPPQAQGQPSEEDIQTLAMALTGQAGEQSEQIVEMFVRRYGPEAFMQMRDMILQNMTPNAQTEGLIQGQGGGMDDQVMGTIGGQQPVAVSPGEYIVPADVVSGLGDGSSDAGAAELDKMSGNVRMARGGSTTQPPPFDARKVLPA